MTWSDRSGRKPFKLNELGFVGRGRSRHRPRDDASLYGGPYPFFQTGDVKAAEFYLSEHKQTYNEKGLAQSKLWDPGTLCITIAANIAESAILNVQGCFPDSVVGFVPDPEKADVRFVKYYIETVKINMQQASRGTTQDNLSLDKLLTFEFRMPSLQVQRKIADILSAYDDLIENNTRRIAILEEMARSLYREWFVDFRFPGHEQGAMEESELGLVPEGWSVERLSSVADVNSESLKRGHGLQTINYVDISSVTTGRIEKIESLPFASAPGRARRIVRNGDTIWSTVRPNRRSYSIVLDPPRSLIVSTGFAVIRPRTVPCSYLYHAVTTENFADYLTNHAKGAAYPAVSAADFENAQILLPPTDLLDRFQTITGDLLALRQRLLEANANLSSTRDVLLPRLMSGDLHAGNIEEANRTRLEERGKPTDNDVQGNLYSVTTRS